MAINNSRKYYDEIGFATSENTAPGIYADTFIRRNYYGDVEYDSVKAGSTDKRISDIDINVRIKILADEFATENAGFIRYAKYRGVKWRVTSYEPLYPRLILTLGGEYNE